jgi:hypothetical protein
MRHGGRRELGRMRRGDLSDRNRRSAESGSQNNNRQDQSSQHALDAIG